AAQAVRKGRQAGACRWRRSDCRVTKQRRRSERPSKCKPRFAEGGHLSLGTPQASRYDFRGRVRPGARALRKASARSGAWLADTCHSEGGVCPRNLLFLGLLQEADSSLRSE